MEVAKRTRNQLIRRSDEVSHLSQCRADHPFTISSGDGQSKYDSDVVKKSFIIWIQKRKEFSLRDEIIKKAKINSILQSKFILCLSISSAIGWFSTQPQEKIAKAIEVGFIRFVFYFDTGHSSLLVAFLKLLATHPVFFNIPVNIHVPPEHLSNFLSMLPHLLALYNQSPISSSPPLTSISPSSSSQSFSLDSYTGDSLNSSLMCKQR